eukprot:11172653-Prorocentrum_lima.AAC.1
MDLQRNWRNRLCDRRAYCWIVIMVNEWSCPPEEPAWSLQQPQRCQPSAGRMTVTALGFTCLSIRAT